MALKSKARSAQYPLVQEYVFNFNDTMIDADGATKSFSVHTDDPVFEVFSLPYGVVVRGGSVSVEVAYIGPPVATLSLGDSGDATRFADAVDLTTVGRTALTLPVNVLSGLNTFGTMVLAGLAEVPGIGDPPEGGSPAVPAANATAGRVRLSIEYTIEGRHNEVQST